VKRSDHPIDRLQCGRPVRIEYNSATNVGKLYMKPGCCTDRQAAIDLFMAIDPKVVLVQTFAGDLPDTFYSRDDSEWTDIPPPKWVR